MMVPREKYQTDSQFHALVDMMVAYIHQCDFTPSELRQASILASIIYEESRIRRYAMIPLDDEAVYTRLRGGDQLGIFQIEASAGMKEMMMISSRKTNVVTTRKSRYDISMISFFTIIPNGK